MRKEQEQLKAAGELTEVNHHKIHVFRAGNPDQPKLVFMSGSGTVAPVYDFKILYEKLKNDFRIIVVEKFGYGYSDVWEAPCDIDSLVNTQRTALDQLGEKGPYILVPHSMAGIEAIRWIRMYPEEIKALIGLDMASPLSYAEWTEADVKRRIRLMSILKKLRLHSLATIPHNDTLSEHDKHQMKLLQKRNAFNDCFINEAKHIKQNAAFTDEHGLINCPALLFCSDGTQTSGNWIQNEKTFAESINAQLICYDCGHYMHYFKSEEISERIKDFIQNQL